MQRNASRLMLCGLTAALMLAVVPLWAIGRSRMRNRPYIH